MTSYPLTDRSSAAYQALVSQIRARLEQEGVAIFPGVVLDPADVAMPEQTLALQARMFSFR
ncbi:hypothetical protein M2D63_026210, partial [Pseudomonas sp. BJa5]|nr:hypothetical protein [Pseudomonas sp. BGr12]